MRKRLIVANLLRGLSMDNSRRACWRGRASPLRGGDRRQRELGLGSPLPPLARPRQQTARLPLFYYEGRWFQARRHACKASEKLNSPFELPPFSFCTRPDKKFFSLLKLEEIRCVEENLFSKNEVPRSPFLTDFAFLKNEAKFVKTFLHLGKLNLENSS